MIELELTYLAKWIPEGLKSFPTKEVMDLYIPKTSSHPKLRVRMNDDHLEMTKKVPLKEGDVSQQREYTIPLSEAEFKALSTLDGKQIHKIRYLYPCQGRTAEIDVFLGDLAGLVLVDVEFDSLKAKKHFKMPDFCLSEVTQEDFIAGGMLCGKQYKDIEADLRRFGYKRLLLR